MEKMVITQVAELQTVVNTVLDKANAQKDEVAVVIALHGDLGAGKTTFTQMLAQTLGVTEVVTSPTFVIMKVYELLEQTFLQLVHIDAYRIEEIDEMHVLGFEALLQQKDTIMCIEWAENIEALLPAQTVHVRITLEGETREITIE